VARTSSESTIVVARGLIRLAGTNNPASRNKRPNHLDCLTLDCECWSFRPEVMPESAVRKSLQEPLDLVLAAGAKAPKRNGIFCSPCWAAADRNPWCESAELSGVNIDGSGDPVC